MVYYPTALAFFYRGCNQSQIFPLNGVKSKYLLGDKKAYLELI